MCGFCGFTGQIASPEEILESMKNKIIHRGPDSDGSHLDDGIAMGFRRLSFVDLAAVSPFITKQEIWLSPSTARFITIEN